MSQCRMPRVASILLLALVALPAWLGAQSGQITGTITNQETGAPMSAVQVSIQGTTLGGLSAVDGTYTVLNVPVGTHTILARRLGFQQVERTGVTVTSGSTVNLTFAMSTQVLSLQGIVATGLVDPVEGVLSPISVARVTREQMPVLVAGSAVQNLQGVVAGVSINRRDGSPGGEVGIMLRTPTSVTGSGEPLLVVDGVILGTGGTSNIQSLDIESIEVIRGAAAASLYGSRAASGVIAITTRRGQGLEIGQTSFSVRSEMGVSQAVRGDEFPTHHQYLVDDAENPTTYVDAAGNPVSRAGRVTGPSHLQFMDQRYPGPTYDNIANVFQGGSYTSHSVSMMQNSAATNFALNFARLNEGGPLENNEGYELNSFRVNLDHRFLENWQVGVTAYHSRDYLDNISLSFAQVVRAPPDVDLRVKDEDGNYLQVPDPTVAYENPLWVQGSRENDRYRIRTLGSANVRWDPTYWLSFSGQVSYDRQDSKTRAYVPKGTPTSITQDIPSAGSISYNQSLSDTWNAEAQVSLRRDFSGLNVRTTFRTLLERDVNENTSASGTDFFAGGVPRVDVAANRNATSSETASRAVGYLWDTAFDYEGKYIATGLIRYDGSSLFGPDDRWHPYYRVGFAWRLAQEDWFNLPHVDEFKLRYARGTAGGRPPFAAQYETWSAGATGVSKGTLGNTFLRPEHTTEQEVTLEAILFNRLGIDLTYAWQRTEDQLVDAELPAYTGYTSQWKNIGTVEGNTIELSIQSQLVQRENFGWSSSFVFDRSTSTMTEWPIACRTLIWRLWCEGNGMYEIWGSLFLTSTDQFSADPSRKYNPLGHHGGRLEAHADEFQVNDDGWLVWVGEGNTYEDGIERSLWGTSTTIEGVTYAWGMPIFDMDANANILRQPIGDGERLNFGWVNTFRYGQFTLSGHLNAVLGGGFVNQFYRTLRLVNQSPEMDQFGKPEGRKKPVAYYTALEGGRGNSSNVEPNDYLKLRSLSLSFQTNESQLDRLGLSRMGISSASLGLVTRNLLTFTRCTCPDPEQAWDVNTRLGQLGGGTADGYPTSRTLTAEVTVTF